MTDQSIFNETNPQEEDQGQPPEQNSNDIFTDQLKLIKNDSGEQKYKDVPSALEALAHAQNHIKNLTAQSKELEDRVRISQEEAEQRESVQAMIERITGKQQAQEQTPNGDQPKETGLDESKILELIQSSLERQSVSQTQNSNLQNVVQTLTSRFGDGAQKAIAERAKEIGTTPKQLQELAKQNPQMVLALFGQVNPTNSSSTTSSINSYSIKPQEKKLEINKKSVTRGGLDNKELAEELRRVREHTYERLGVVK